MHVDYYSRHISYKLSSCHLHPFLIILANSNFVNSLNTNQYEVPQCHVLLCNIILKRRKGKPSLDLAGELDPSLFIHICA